MNETFSMTPVTAEAMALNDFLSSCSRAGLSEVAIREAMMAMLLPKEPSAGLLMSMAIRFDHSLGMGLANPGFEKDEAFCARRDALLVRMRQLYEEVSGHGFYSPEKEAMYSALV